VAINYRQLNPKIGWVETVTGFLVMAGGATFLGGMLFGLSPSERDWQSTRLAAAGGLWVLLGALSVIARFRQWRFRKKQKSHHLRDVMPGERAAIHGRVKLPPTPCHPERSANQRRARSRLFVIPSGAGAHATAKSRDLCISEHDPP
jgi:hypothetical protein